MKLTRQSVLTASSLLIGGFIGASALVAFASGTWTAPTATPPDGNVDAPINVGSVYQNRSGKLGLGAVVSYTNEANRPLMDVNGSGMFTNLGVTGNLVVSSGASTVANTVLTNDGTGKASWVAVGSGNTYIISDIRGISGIASIQSKLPNVTIYSGDGTNIRENNIKFGTWNAGYGLATDAVTRGKICSSIFTDAPNPTAFNTASGGSPSFNGGNLLYYDTPSGQWRQGPQTNSYLSGSFTCTGLTTTTY